MIFSKVNSCILHQFDPSSSLPRCPNQSCLFFSDRRERAQCAENSKKYSLVNKCNAHIALHHVDEGIAVHETDSTQKKCDYMFLLDSNRREAIFVELKGSKILKACDQIEQTIAAIDLKSCRIDSVHGRIIASNVPRSLLRDARYVRLQKQLKKLHGELKIATGSLTENVEDLLR